MRMNIDKLIALLLISFLTGCGGNGGSGSSGNRFTLSGEVLASSNATVDSDTNDPFQTATANNTFATAQNISGPISFGGYVGTASAAPAGRFFGVGDANDYYRIHLAANQLITVSFVEPTVNDVDLYLYNSAEELVDASVSTTARQEWIRVPANGEYYIRVTVAASATDTSARYILTVGDAINSNALPDTLRLSSEFVIDEAIVSINEPKPQHLAFSTRLQPHKRMTLRGTNRALAAFTNKTRQEHKLQTLLDIKTLRRNSGIADAGPNYIIHPTLQPNDPGYVQQWHYPLINLPLAWDTETGSANTIVAVIDTGVLPDHPDMEGRFVPGYDFISDPDNARDGDGIDSDPTDEGDFAFFSSSSFHGTHVAGTIAANTNNDTGVAGVNWNARIMPLRVLGTEGGTLYDMEQALRFAAGLSNDSGTVPDQIADVINLSLGSPDFSASTQTLINEIRARGVIVVAAAGNDGSDRVNYPAGYDGVVSVSAVALNKDLASYSNYGSTIDIAAPGGSLSDDINGDGFGDGVLSSVAEDSLSGSNINYTYAFFEGTSMATPHIAGVISLMKAQYPAMTPEEFDNMLAAGELTEDLGAASRDNEFGWGLIDANKAINAAITAAGGVISVPQPILLVSPSQINFGAVLNNIRFSASQGSSADVTIISITDNADWLTVTPPASTTGLGNHIATVDRSNLSEGIYQATITVVSSANTVNIPVAVEVDPLATGADAGFHYILLFDEETGAVYQAVAASNSGVYAFSFADLPAGVYTLYAGTDLDNDNSLCQFGEACGAYRVLERPTIIELNQNVSGLQFSTRFSAPLTNNGAFLSRATWKKIIK